jgi:hypothetical protein
MWPWSPAFMLMDITWHSLQPSSWALGKNIINIIQLATLISAMVVWSLSSRLRHIKFEAVL